MNIDIHDVKSVEVCEPTKLTHDNGTNFYVRDIVIRSDNEKVTLKLFSDEIIEVNV